MNDSLSTLASDKPYGVIYLVTNKVNGKRYVGQTIRTTKERWRGHCKPSKIKLADNGLLSLAIAKHGKDQFEMVEIDRADSKEELDYLERYWIRFYRTTKRGIGYNLKDGGANGKPSPESVEKMAKTKRGRKLPPTHPFCQSNTPWSKARIATPEWREQHSKTMKELFASGKMVGNKGRVFAKQRKPVVCVETGQVFESRSLAAQFVKPGYSAKEVRGLASSIFQATKTGKEAFGYHWKDMSIHADLVADDHTEKGAQ